MCMTILILMGCYVTLLQSLTCDYICVCVFAYTRHLYTFVTFLTF